MIDKLRLCFKAESALLESLADIEIGEVVYFNDVALVRVYEDDAYHNVYYIHQINDNANLDYWGKFKFNLKIGGIQGNSFKDGRPKSWVSVDNRILYNCQRLRFIYTIEKKLRLVINNITQLDLCVDVGFNISKSIKKRLHDKDTYTILNGNIIHDRKADRPEITYDFSGTLDQQLKYLTVYIKQLNSARNKNKGLTVCSYNKKHEIEKISSKKYILDYYGNPKTLHRLEVRIDSENASTYFKKRSVPLSLDFLFDQSVLDEMYYHFLDRVIRFRRGAKRVIPWKSILDKVNDKHPSQGKELTVKSNQVN
ncbi:hypothetical protein LJB87_01920 [Alistipes sp. OttesenSCG-928-L06]|nr:hypothetical protein [Alistipes sp. OttesenSCG-928-L06]